MKLVCDWNEPDDTEHRQSSVPAYCYIPLLVPAALFFVSLYVRPMIGADAGFGFIALRNMLDGGAFNMIVAPDPANIANDATTFLTWWSPGQYLAPGLFVWLGADYGVALCLTSLIGILIGSFGWARLARSISAPPVVILLFLSALLTFRFGTLPFRLYNAEVLLFAAAPWCLIWLRSALEMPPLVCFAITLASVAVLFFAKLTGLIVFATDVLALGALDVLRRRRVTGSLVAMTAASIVAACVFWEFWAVRGVTPEMSQGFAVTWPAIWVPVAGAAFSGFSALDLLAWLLTNPATAFFSDIAPTSYILGPLGLALMVWTWLRLKQSGYRRMAVLPFTLIALYTAAFAASYVRSPAISFEERHFRYAGIVFLLMLLLAVHTSRRALARSLVAVAIAVFAIYGFASYASDARDRMSSRSYDRQSGTYQQFVTSAVFDYLRSQAAEHGWRRPVVMLPSSSAAPGLARFRIIVAPAVALMPVESIAEQKWAGRAEKLFVVLDDRIDSDKVKALLATLVDYAQDKWDQVKLDGMTVYSQ